MPPGDEDVETLFSMWRQDLPQARKFLIAARDYVAASLWRRAGLRIRESYMLDIRDWRRDLGAYGNVHVRFGKGSRGRGYLPVLARLVRKNTSSGSRLWLARRIVEQLATAVR